MVQQSKKSEFEFRDKLESWVEGIFETIAGYIRTVYFFNFRFVLHPKEGAKQLELEATESASLTQPATFMIVSYFLMAYLIKGVDFSDPVFAFNLSKLLDILGVLEAAKSLDVEKVMLGILPAIGLLFFFCYFSHGVLYLFREKVDQKVFRRRYSYVLGETFITIGAGCSAYWYVVKPLVAKSWWLGLPVHILTVLPFLSGIILVVLYPLPNESVSTKGATARFIARTLPWTILTLIIWYFTGSWGFMDYRKAQ